MAIIPKGSVLIPGRGRATAEVALKAAENKKLSSSVVRTVREGYVVPQAVADEFESLVKASGESKSTKSAKSAKSTKSDADADAKAETEEKAKADTAKASATKQDDAKSTEK